MVPEGGKWNGAEDMFQEIMTEHFPKLMKKKVKKPRSSKNSKISCDILVKLLKKKILKASKEKEHYIQKNKM